MFVPWQEYLVLTYEKYLINKCIVSFSLEKLVTFVIFQSNNVIERGTYRALIRRNIRQISINDI